jgi:hypothetical protein
MPDSADPNARPDYPDVLGSITGGTRHVVSVVQCALGVYPRAAVIGQPFEALVLVQNASDQLAQVMVTIQLPRKDTQGRRISLVTTKDVFAFEMQPAEVGLLHIPIVPHLPTQPGEGNPISTRVDVKPSKSYNLVRPLQGGRPPALLNLSPTRLNILRQLGFSGASQEPGVLSTTFDISPTQSATTQTENVPPRYEALWRVKELANEQAKYAALAEKAQRFARIFTPANIMDSMVALTTRRYHQIGLPLLSGESLAISKALIYAMLDGTDKTLRLAERRWFQRLVIHMEDVTLSGDLRKLIAALYPAIAHDAARMGLSAVERASGESLGSPREHLTFADDLVSVLEGQKQGGLVHIYLPLALVGILLNGQIVGPREDPWISLSQVDDARKNRLSSADSQDGFIFGLLDKFIDSAEQYLVKANVPKPR